MSDTENEDYKSDAPLLDSFGSALKKLIAKGKEQGYITIEELNQALPSEKETSDQIEDIMAAIFSSQVVLQLVHTSRYTAERSRFANCFCNGQARMAQSLPGLRCWTCVCIA